MYTAHVIDKYGLQLLVRIFPPTYERLVAHHVTVEFGVKKGTAPPEPARVNVIGYQDSGDGLEVLVVEVNGERRRPDGGLYHITWSIDPNSNYKPKDSNKLLADRGYMFTTDVIAVATTPDVLK